MLLCTVMENVLPTFMNKYMLVIEIENQVEIKYFKKGLKTSLETSKIDNIKPALK